uniref:TonB-dependent receptor n=1 Tax=candidate division WOR-3 bacterium TaxID=2052148 RepID=A0A7C3YUX6_UNCW3
MVKLKGLIFILIVSLLFAGPTGKIVGRVVDASTGEPLVGCDVVVLGTELGASVEKDGRFSIINVPVGTYDVEASMVGYTPVVVKGVRVMADQVTVVNFKLSPTVIEQKPVEVIGERPMVVPSAVQTTRISSAEDIARLPITQVTQLIGLSAGVVSRGGFQYIRGGRNDEIVTLVDGIAAVDPFYHIAYHRPPSASVEEVQLITGGFDAEYGEAMSGVVQISTKEGGERLSGGVRYTTDDFMPKELDFGYNLYQLNFGGPLGTKSFRFFFSGELWNADDANPTRYRLPKPRQEYTGQGKISYRLPKTRLSLDYYTSCLQWDLFSNAWKYWLKRAGAVRSYGDKFGFVLNTMPDKNTVLEVRLGYHFYDRMQSVRDYSAEEADKSHLLEKLGIWQKYIMKSEDFVFRNERIPDHPIYDNKPAPPETAILYLFKDERAAWEEGTPYTTNNPWGVYGMFYGVGDYRLWHYRQSKTYIGKVDYTKQIGTVHEMKTGFEAKFYNLWLLENSLPWTSMPFWDAYRKKPYQFAAYIQDRANFEDLVIRAGLRFDFIHPRSKKDATPYNVIDDSLVEAKPKFKISPRLGIAFPITERIKFRFSYGHFFQTPSFTNLYESLEADIVRRGNIIVGDPDLDAQKTISYETGFEAQLSDIFAFDLTLFYKDIYDLVGTRPISALPMSYTILTNVEYGRTFGFELGFQKRLSQYWQARASYTFQIAKGTAADAWQWYSYNYQGIPFTQIDYYLDYDQRHLLNFDFGLSFPSDFFFWPLRNFNSGLVFTYGTGFPYTPTDLRGTRTGDLNSGRMPSTWNCDLRLSKEFRLGGIRPVLVCDVLNLFNHINVTNVHSATGLPNFDGQVYTVGQFSSGYIPGDPTYHPARDYDHDGYITQWERYDSYIQARKDYVDDPTNYGPPRRIRVGVEFGF